MQQTSTVITRPNNLNLRRLYARRNALQASDYTIWIMLTISLSANMLRITFTRSVEAETVDSVAQGRRTPFARRSLSFFQTKSLRALLLGLKEAPVRTSVVY